MNKNFKALIMTCFILLPSRGFCMDMSGGFILLAESVLLVDSFILAQGPDMKNQNNLIGLAHVGAGASMYLFFDQKEMKNRIVPSASLITVGALSLRDDYSHKKISDRVIESFLSWNASLLIMASASEYFKLSKDIQAYPEFLPNSSIALNWQRQF